MIKKLPIGIQSFEKIITNYLYIDKTEQIHRLLSSGEVYFLSRPRRFGKSLLCSTLEALFKGQRHLFKGLWIDRHEVAYDWKEYPVIHLSMAKFNTQSAHLFEQSLMLELTRCSSLYAVKQTDGINNSKDFFIVLVEELAKRAPVVIIVDEYDKPIISHLHNIALAKEMRDTLKNFYGALKELDKYLKFLFITGVSKFSRTSIFSDLNHLKDISLDESATQLCGYTQHEIDTNFHHYLEQAAHKNKISISALKEELKAWYNGYQFAEKQSQQTLVYNPFSVLNFLDTGDFNNYWFSSGSPTFLIDKIKEVDYPLTRLEETELSCAAMDIYDVDKMDLKVLLFQTGYLTIKPGSKTNRLLAAGIPNEEVRLSLFEQFAQLVTNYSYEEAPHTVELLKGALYQHNIPAFIETLTSFLADIPYLLHVKNERYYQTIFYILCKLSRASVVVEDQTNLGRIDAVITTPQRIYIFEFKVNQSPTVALEQIKQRKYFEKFLNMKKAISLIGINFDSIQKNITFREEHLA